MRGVSVSRRANQEGTFEQLPSGKWSCYTVTGGKKIRGKPGLTRKDASENLRVRLLNLAAESDKSAKSFTIFAERWIKGLKLSPTTTDTYFYWHKSLSEDPLGDMAPSKITNDDLAAWKKRQKLANETLRKRCTWINQILKEAKSTARVEVPKKKDHTRRPMSPGERVDFLQLMSGLDDDYKIAAILCWYCGLRRSEACGLRIEDFDGEGFWVRRVALLVRAKVVIRLKGKSARAHGWVPAPPALTKMIEGRKGFVITGTNDPLNPKVLSEFVSALIKGTTLANVPHMGLHALRRTYGMMLLESGADVVTAAKAMRHDPSMLLNEYARSRPDLMKKAVLTSFPDLIPQETTPKTGT